MPPAVSGRLAGKTVLVTGGGTGIGRAVCLRAAREGAAVVLGYHSSERDAHAVQQEIRAFGGTALALKADIRSSIEARRLVTRTLDAMGALHVLVNNAAVVHRASFLDYSESDWDETIAVNLRGPFICAQEAARAMARLEIRGRILNISSIGGMLAHSNLCAYDASKAGLDMLTRSEAVALAPLGITVNAVCPGAIHVERNQDEFAGPQAEQLWKRIIPLGAAGQPVDVAAAVVFLASEEAGFITGHVLVVDGGQSATLYSP
jgi:NAD(P)-dependent dehydrogenase (short-subunit alcohol dehydrogenase family)